jgi:hypothetical protein
MIMTMTMMTIISEVIFLVVVSVSSDDRLVNKDLCLCADIVLVAAK